MIPPISIFLTAFILRFFHIAGQETRNDFFSYFWLVDSSPYLHYAHKLLSGESFLAWQSPLVSYVLAVYFYLIDGDHFGGKLVLAVLGAATCSGVYFLGRQLAGTPEAIVAGFLSATSFGLIMASGSYNSEVLQGFLLIAILYTSHRFAIKKTLWLAGFIGGLGGLAVFNRGEFVMVLPFLTVWLAYHSRTSFKRSVEVLGIAVFGLLIALAPNIYRNYDFFHRLNHKIVGSSFQEIYFLAPYNQFIFARSNSPLNPVRSERRIFGSNEGPEQTEVNWLLDPLHRRMYFEGRRLGWDYILKDIPRFLVTTWRRTQVLADVFTFGFLETNWPSGLTGRHGKGDCFTPDLKILICIQLPLFLMGAVTAWRRCPLYHLLPATLVICTLIVNAFFFGMTRYGVYLLPLIFIYTAAGLVWLLRIAWKLRQWMVPKSHWENKISLAFSFFLIVIGTAQYSLGVEVRPARDFFLDGVISLRENQPKKAITQWESAFKKLNSEGNIIRDDLMLGRFSFKLAELYYRTGKKKMSLKELDRTLGWDPFHMNALLNRGILLVRLDDRSRAKEDFLRLLQWYPNHPQAIPVFKQVRLLVPSVATQGEELRLTWSENF